MAQDLYALVDCSTNKICKINGKRAIFEFKGQYNTGCHPEQLLGKILTHVIDAGMVKHEGCYKFIDYNKKCSTFPFDYKYFFAKAVICDSCINCKQEVVPEILRPLVYAKHNTPIMDSDSIVKNMCSFVQVVYQEMAQRKLGIKFCCQNDLIDAKITHFDTLLKLNGCIEYKPEIEPANPELENKTCVFTINSEFSEGFIEMYITIEKNEFPILKSGALSGESVYQDLIGKLNALGKGVWTYSFINKTISVTGKFEYSNLIYTVGNTAGVTPSTGMSFIFQPVCTLL